MPTFNKMFWLGLQNHLKHNHSRSRSYPKWDPYLNVIPKIVWIEINFSNMFLDRLVHSIKSDVMFEFELRIHAWTMASKSQHIKIYVDSRIIAFNRIYVGSKVFI